MKIVIIAAHPDDEVIGCGGSIAKWAKAGHEVHVVIMAEGATSRDQNRDRVARSKEINSLHKAARVASDILGATSLAMLDFPDNRMDSADKLDVIKAVETHINKIKPGMVVTHYASDLNVDHQIVHDAVITACRPEPDQSVQRLLAFEVASSTEWRNSIPNTSFSPNVFENIADTIEIKKLALNAYASEMREWPHPRSIRAIEHLARWRGATIGFEAAEACSLIREIKE